MTETEGSHHCGGPIWMPCSAEILALDGQGLYLCLDGAHSDVTPRVSRGGPGTDQEGLCVVRITHDTTGEEEHPTGTEPGRIAALESGHSEFLNAEAVALIGPNEDEDSPIKLALHLRFEE